MLARRSHWAPPPTQRPKASWKFAWNHTADTWSLSNCWNEPGSHCLSRTSRNEIRRSACIENNESAYDLKSERHEAARGGDDSDGADARLLCQTRTIGIVRSSLYLRCLNKCPQLGVVLSTRGGFDAAGYVHAKGLRLAYGRSDILGR